MLIAIKHLVNGTSVAQVETATVTYFHIELAQHDVLLAEGLPAESYLDTGDRSHFANAGEAVPLHPDFAGYLRDAMACAPLKVVGPEIEAVRQRLKRRLRGMQRMPRRRAA